MRMKDITIIALFENASLHQLKIDEKTKSDIIRLILNEEGGLKVIERPIDFTETYKQD